MKTIRKYFTLLFLGAGLLAWVLFTYMSGFRLSVVQSGSMEPAVPTYSVCAVDTRAEMADLSVGDIVVYLCDGQQIIHRVTAIDGDVAEVKGDANARPDDVLITAQNLYGRYVGHVPGVGRVVNALHSGPGIALMAAALIALVVSDIRQNKGPRGHPARGIT